MNPNDVKAIKAETERLNKQIEIQKANLSKLPKEKQEIERQAIAKEEQALKDSRALIFGKVSPAVASATNPKFPKPGEGGAPGSSDEPYAPGGALGTATSSALGAKPGSAAKASGTSSGVGSSNKPVQMSGSLEVRVNAICVDCGREDAQATAILPIKGN
jgi:hypothetical protein